MPLMTWMIGLACSNIYQNHQDACSSAMLATAKQTKIYQIDEKTENYYTLQANSLANDTLGNGTVDVIGSTAYAYKAYKNKAVDFKLPSMGICDSASNHITNNSYSINLNWHFPWK